LIWRRPGLQTRRDSGPERPALQQKGIPPDLL